MAEHVTTYVVLGICQNICRQMVMFLFGHCLHEFEDTNVKYGTDVFIAPLCAPFHINRSTL